MVAWQENFFLHPVHGLHEVGQHEGQGHPKPFGDGGEQPDGDDEGNEKDDPVERMRFFSIGLHDSISLLQN